MTALILASQSTGRRQMLESAGVPFEALAAFVDEEAARAGMSAMAPRDIADALAELKAVKVSSRIPGALVLGSDQVLAMDDGTILAKPGSRDEAADHLRRLSGKTHYLHSAAVIAEQGRVVWRSLDRATLTVRTLSDPFIEAYLDREWPAIAGCVGCYRVEGPGLQLFSRIEGSHFTIIGMPLLAVLDYLRTRGVLTR